MKIKTFEDIVVWQKSKVLCLEIHRVFKSCRDYSFRDQITRASISIMDNIAEGYERNGNKEFRNFLYIAKGSCGEVRSMLQIALSLGYITRKDYDLLFELSIEVSKMLSGFIRTLRTL